MAIDSERVLKLNDLFQISGWEKKLRWQPFCEVVDIYRLYEGDELYDRVTDPGELHNLAGSPEAEPVERELREQVLHWLVQTSDVIPWDEDPRS